MGGSGVIQHFGDGSSTLSLEDLAVLMITLSDNTATNILIDALGMNAVNRTLADLGFGETRLQRKMIQPEASLRGEENVSTPAEAAALMTRLARCDLPVNQASCRRITEILEIPKGGAVREPVPGSVRIAFKPGTLEGVATVWAYVELPDRPYVLAVMANYGGDGDAAVGRISEAAYRYFAKLARATPHGTRVPLEVIRRRYGRWCPWPPPSTRPLRPPSSLAPPPSGPPLSRRRVSCKEAGIRRDMLSMVRQALGDRYTVEREIGRGGAARVFLAQDREGMKVALKILHPELALSVTAQRFLREIAMLAKLQHPHIAQMVDYGELEYMVYYAMRFIEGQNLRVHIDRAHRLSVPDTVRLACDVLDALAAAHRQAIVHRDVKPENVILASHGAVLLDFGIARAIAASGTERLTRSGFTVGTSAYMSPEQVNGSLEIDHRSDLYSLGCVLFECLAGSPPFHDPLEEAVLKMHAVRPAPDVRRMREDTPRPLADAIDRALEKEPRDRWQSASEMLDALAAVKA